MITSRPQRLLTGRLVWSLVGAALALAMLALSATRASAAPPTLTTSENPVVIPNGSTTKQVTLSWNLNGYPWAAGLLSVQENGGPVVATTAVTTQTGSLPLTVAYPKSYTATLIDPALNAPLATLQITTKRSSINLPPGVDLSECLLNPCITSVTFDSHGTYAEFTVKTTKAAKFQMAICGTIFTPSGSCPSPVAGTFNFQYVNEWSSHITGLAPNTTYHYQARAEDQQGNVRTKTGTFTTLKRRVEVTFADIKVTDDSDDLSPCDCTFWFQVENQQPKSYGEVSVSTGNWVHPNVKFTVDNAPDTLTLRVEGQDDDSDAFDGLCTNGTAPGWHSGSHGCMSYTGGSFTIHTDTETGFGEEFTGSFSGPWLNYSGELNFDLYGSFKVTYVP